MEPDLKIISIYLDHLIMRFQVIIAIFNHTSTQVSEFILPEIRG